jgi:hypothetical protein
VKTSASSVEPREAQDMRETEASDSESKTLHASRTTLHSSKAHAIDLSNQAATRKPLALPRPPMQPLMDITAKKSPVLSDF